MFIDARMVDDSAQIEGDLCIIGAGAAGLTLASELSDSPLRIVLVESGDLKLDEKIQHLAAGENVGRKYFDLDATRLRMFGGTTNHWGGRCLPLRPFDFRQRNWIPHSGWPISYTDVEPYYRRAHDIIGIGEFDYDTEDLAKQIGETLLPLDPKIVSSIWTRSRALRFGDAYHDLVDRSPRIVCLLRAHVLAIETGRDSTTVDHVSVGTLEGRRFTVRAQRFVLAAGGLANPRLLLLSTGSGSHPNGLGNDNDLVGRFFMEHLLYFSGHVAVADRTEDYRLYNDFIDVPNADYKVQTTLALTEEVVEQAKTTNVYFELFGQRGFGFTPGIMATRDLLQSAVNRHWPREFPNHLADLVTDVETLIDAGAYFATGNSLLYPDPPLAFRVYNFSEQAPNPNSRVTLGDDRDAFGLQRIRLDWQITELDVRSAQTGHEILAREVGRSALGRMRFDLDIDEPLPMPNLSGGHHHMGTTRMARDPRDGVVDPDGRVHGLTNLYVAGSSIFPTAGFANPTLTLVALAIRLADHLKSQLKI